MARRARASKRDIQPDPIYRSRLVTQVVNRMMIDGKKSTAEHIMYDAMNLLRERTGNDPAGVLKEAVENVRPALEVRSRRVGGANYQVPVEVPTRRSYTLAVRWIITHSRARREHTMAERLAGRAARRLQPHRHDHEEERRPAAYGRGQQGLRPLPLVVTAHRRIRGK